MINFEKNIATGEKSLESLEKRGGLKESLAEMVKNFSIKINKLLANFKAQDSEVAEIDKSSELTVEEIDYVKEESKIEEKLASLNEVAERVAVETDQEINRALVGESSAETPDLYKKTEDYINSESFEAAKDSFLLMENKLERTALLETYPQFLDYYENSVARESGESLSDKKNIINPNFDSRVPAEEEAQNISTLISGKNIEEIDKIFSNEQERSILLKSSLDMLKKRGKITEEEQKTKETLLKFIEIRSSVFEKIIESKNLEDASNSVLLYSSLVNNGNEVQQKSGMELLKKHLDLVKQITTSYTTTSYEQGDYYNSDAKLLRRSILEKGDKDVKGEAQKWFEETISSDKFDVNTIFCLQKLYGKDKKKIVDFAKTYIEKHDLPAEKLLKDWKLAKIEPHLGFASIKKLEDKMPGAAKVLHQEFKISDFWRYPTEVLVDQYNNRDNTDMPYGVIIFPNADHNGAFEQNSHLIEKLYEDTKGKYLLRIMEADGKFSLARNLLFLNKKYGDKHKISFGLLGGHGSKNSIQFGQDTLSNFFSEKNILSKKDFKGEGVKKIKSFFEEDPSIALISCSTGKERGIGQQISETYGAEIHAPDRPAAMIQLSTSFDQNGKIKFGTKYYHSGLEMKYSKGVKK